MTANSQPPHRLLHELLFDSVFYPACATDSTALRLLSRYFCRFVLADPTVHEGEISQCLQRIKGYDVLKLTPLRPEELGLRNGWGDAAEWAHEKMSGPLNPPYAIWAVLKRQPNCDVTHGAEFLSVLCLGLEGVWCRKKLYDRKKIMPSVLTIIQPGHAFGGNWTDFTDSTQPLLRNWVRNNTLPPYLLTNYETDYLNARGSGRSLANLYPICSDGKQHHGVFLRCRAVPAGGSRQDAGFGGRDAHLT
jgi:hypothetical protein